ncbi:MAG: hypothetical protein Q7J07_07740 [Pelolinea sp.]|nr:hypothetical protein [Pelolinea sp.]
MDDFQAQLLTEQFLRLKDSIETRLQNLNSELTHHQKLETERLNLIKLQIETNRNNTADQETRIRKIDDAVISNKTSTTIIQAGQAALTLIAAAIAAWLGGKA